jgi:hypothetical protein
VVELLRSRDVATTAGPRLGLAKWNTGDVNAEFPDFSIPHQEKIDWMVDTHGWALEAVPPDAHSDPPRPGFAYTVGFPETFDFPEVAVFGLQPVAANGLLGLVADCLRGGTEIPLGVEVTGLLDGELRCMFAPVDLAVWGGMFPICSAWRRGRPFALVQLLWPDRNGFLPYEIGYSRPMVYAQPVIGTHG